MRFAHTAAMNIADCGGLSAIGYRLLVIPMRQLSLVLLLITLANLPASPARAQDAAALCFAETSHCVTGPLRTRWERDGGLAVFGLPLSPQRPELVEGQPTLVQWFERARLELPESATSPDNVRLGLVGAELLAAQGRDWTAYPHSFPQPDCTYFPETGHSLCGPLLRVWEASGGLGCNRASRARISSHKVVPVRQPAFQRSMR